MDWPVEKSLWLVAVDKYNEHKAMGETPQPRPAIPGGEHRAVTDALQAKLLAAATRADLVKVVLQALVDDLGCERAAVLLGNVHRGGFDGFRHLERGTECDQPCRARLQADDPHLNALSSSPDGFLLGQPARQIVAVVWPESAGALGDVADAAVIGLRSASDVLDGLLIFQADRDKGLADPQTLRDLGTLGGRLAQAMRRAWKYEQSELERRRLSEVVELQRSQSRAPSEFGGIVGRSPAIRQAFDLIERLSDVDTTVLIVGPTGTGKELVARALHQRGRRSSKPFMAVNCGAIPEHLLESELFGHERGAFTGAVARRPGKVERAEGGTLFLDEISELPVHLQVKLLRFLQERTFERVGGIELLHADVNVIAATNRDPQQAVRDGQLREDLFYRLNVVTVRLPPLSHRREDIPLLASHFLRYYSARHGRKVERIGPRAAAELMSYSWPGNVRELENAIEKAVVVEPGTEIQTFHLPAEPGEVGAKPDEAAGMSLTQLKRRVVERFERQYLTEKLAANRGNISAAAREAGIDKKNFMQKMRKYALRREDYR